MSDRVLVVGATGGVGQLTVAKLLEKGFLVRVLTRSAGKVQQMFGERVEVSVGDIRQPETLPPAMVDIDFIICSTGTTAFPSARWEFDIPPQFSGLQRLQEWSKIYLDAAYRNAKAKNSPEKVDAEGVGNLAAAAPRSLKRFVLVSSCGIERKDKPPYSVLNACGVLDAKQKGEEAVRSGGFTYTIIRPGRLIDGPYTSYDLNTLLKATTGGKLGISLGTGDKLTGQTSRIDVAAACVECLKVPVTAGKVFEIISKGTRPAVLDWAIMFAQID